MNCPKCGNEIAENTKFCTNCGAEINKAGNADTNQTACKMGDFVKSKPFIISVITLIAFVAIGACIFIGNNIYNNLKNDIYVELPGQKQNYSEYKSITYISDIDKLTLKQSLDKIIQQENDLKEFLSQNHTEEQNSTLFAVFYQNVVAISKKIDKTINDTENSVQLDAEKPTLVSNVEFSPHNINLEKNTGYYKITLPKTELFRSTTAIINETIEPNYKYINDTFSKYLTKPYKDFLNFKMQDQILRKDQSLWVNEHRNNNIAKTKISDNILFLRKLIDTYPDFALWENATEDIKIYVDALLFEDWKMPNEPPIKKVLADFLKVAKKDTFEYDTVKELYNLNINEDGYETSWEAAYRNWYDRTFYNYEPIITQYEINMHAIAEKKYYDNIFKNKVKSFKDLKLDDNGTLIKFIDDYKKRKEIIELVVFPYKNDDPQFHYGSSFPMQLSGLESSFNDLELYTYQKITDTYENNYEHVNKIKQQGYHEYYEKVVQNILNSEYFAQNMKKYIDNYEQRKKSYREVVSSDMKDTDFSVWFDKLELYSYNVILIGMSGLQDLSDEIDKIFEQ